MLCVCGIGGMKSDRNCSLRRHLFVCVFGGVIGKAVLGLIMEITIVSSESTLTRSQRGE